EARVGEDDDVLENVGQWLMPWYAGAIGLVNAHNSHARDSQRIEANKAVGRMSGLREEVRAVMRGGGGVAGWSGLAGADPLSAESPSRRASPGDVSGMLAPQVWAAPTGPEGVPAAAKAEFAQQIQAYQDADEEDHVSAPRWPRHDLPVVT